MKTDWTGVARKHHKLEEIIAITGHGENPLGILTHRPFAPEAGCRLVAASCGSRMEGGVASM